MPEYNFYIKEQGQTEEQAVKLNDTPLLEPKYIFDPDEIGDGDFVALVEVLINSASIGFKYRVEFSLNQQLKFNFPLTGGMSVEAQEGDGLLFVPAFELESANFIGTRIESFILVSTDENQGADFVGIDTLFPPEDFNMEEL